MKRDRRSSSSGFVRGFELLLLFAATAAQAAITGTLVDESGKPVAGATIRAYAAEEWRARSAQVLTGKLDIPVIGHAQSAENGVFRIDVKGPVADLVIEAAGQQPHVEEAADGDDVNVIVLHARPARRVHLVSGGKPVANGALVSGPFVLHSDPDGYVDLPDSMARTKIIAPDFAPTLSPVVVDENGRDVIVSRGVAVKGRVLTADGQPVANAAIIAGGWPLARSAADGTFTIPHVPAAWRVLMAIEGARAGLVTNARAQSFEIRVKPAATITGTTLPGSRVTITYGSESDLGDSIVADAQGKFTSGPLPAGHYTIRSFRRGYAMASAEATVQDGAQVSRKLSPTPLGLIRGRVVDEQKQPVAGAFVTVSPFGNRGGLVMTGANGEFAVRRPEHVTTPVVVLKSGYAAGSSGVLPPNKSDVTITLPHGFPLQVRVIDRARKPVPGAMLSVSGGTPDDYTSHFDAACEQPLSANCRTTSDSGVVNLRATEGPYMVAVMGSSIVTKRLPSQNVTAQSSPLTIEVERGVEVTGRVVYADGTPLTEGFVSVRLINFGTAARLESDGSFAFHNVPPGKLGLVAMTVPVRIESPPVEVDAPARGVVITIPTPARIEGRVTDKDTGQPVTDFQVVAGSRDSRNTIGSPQTVHNDNGAYTLDPVAPGALQLVFAAAGYAQGTLNDITVEQGKTARGVDIQLDKGGSIAGHVTANGQPVSGAVVTFGNTGGMPMMTRTINSTTTDDNGDFVVEGIGSGDRTLQFAKDGFVAKRKNVQVERGKQARADVELDAGRELQGRVVDKSGQPVSGARISAMPVGGGMGARAVTSDASGAFTLSTLADGRYNINASKEGLVSAQATDVTVPATQPLTLTLDTGGTLSGRITGLTDAELAAAEVSANARGTYARAQVNADGTFTIKGVPDGPLTVYAFVRSGVRPRQSHPQTVEVVSGTGPQVQIDFNQGLTVSGHVTRNGTPVTTGAVNFSGVKGSRFGMIGSDGMYQVEGLVAGDYMVTANGPTGMLYRAKLTVENSTTYDIQIKGGSVHGRVLDSSSGTPLSEALVVVTPTKDNPAMRQATTDSEGNFTLDAMADGTIEIRASHDQYAPGTQTVNVSGGTAANAEIRLETTQPTVFRVTDAQSGAPLDAMISVSDGRKMVTQSRSMTRDDDGGIRVYVGSGHYKANIYSRGYGNQTVDFDAPNPDVRVTLSLAGRLLLTASKPTHVLVKTVPLFPSGPPTGVGGVVSTVSRGAIAIPSGAPVENLNPGSYMIDVLGSAPNVILKSIPVTVYAGQTTTVSVD